MAVSGPDSSEIHSLMSIPSQLHSRSDLNIKSPSDPHSGGDDVNPESVSGPITSDRQSLDRKKVLVVDDEEYVRGIVRTMLDDLGYEAIEACDGDQGLKTFEHSKNKFAACIIDLTMPGMAGLELLELIRAQDAAVPVLLVSGYARHEVRQREASSTSVSFLQKPFTLAQFKSAIDSHLDAA